MFWNRKASEGEEFKKTWFGPKSRDGFRVELRSRNWIDHISKGKRRRVFAEPMAGTRGWIIYNSADNRMGFGGLNEDRVAQIYAEIYRALRFLGYAVDPVD